MQAFCTTQLSMGMISPVSSATGEEVIRHDFTPYGMLPADQRLHGRDVAGVEIDLGLEEQVEFIAAQGLA